MLLYTELFKNKLTIFLKHYNSHFSKLKTIYNPTSIIRSKF